MLQALVSLLLLVCGQCTNVETMEEIRARLGSPFPKLREDVDYLLDYVNRLKVNTDAIMQCGIPNRIHNAEMEITGGAEHTFTATYTCWDGYHGYGDVFHSSCSHETWSDIDLVCNSCEAMAIDNADVVYSVHEGIVTAHIACWSGYSSIGDVFQSTCNDGSWTSLDLTCVDLSNCYRVVNGMAVYSGTKSTTTGGKTCQKWSSQYPQTHSVTDAGMADTSGLGVETKSSSSNYCRDPDREGYTWCYTTNWLTRWQACNVPAC